MLRYQTYVNELHQTNLYNENATLIFGDEMNMLTAGLLTWIWDGNAFQFVLNLIDEFLSNIIL